MNPGARGSFTASRPTSSGPERSRTPAWCRSAYFLRVSIFRDVGVSEQGPRRRAQGHVRRENPRRDLLPSTARLPNAAISSRVRDSLGTRVMLDRMLIRLRPGVHVDLDVTYACVVSLGSDI